MQLLVGVLLLVGWVRHARGAGTGPVVAHTALMVGYLVPWAVFIATGHPVWAWGAVGVLSIGIPFGDVLMVHRSRRIRGERRPGLRDYGPAIGDVFAGRMPAKVAFHALFGGVVFFGSVGVAIGATVVAA